MTPLLRKILHFSLISSFAFIIFGCSAPVRHINSDVCLVKQGNSPKEVLDVLGPPNIKTQTKDGELWTYYSAQESPLKRTPGLGLLFGSVSYDVVHITYANNMVANCQYRHANEEEFKQAKFNSKIKEQ